MITAPFLCWYFRQYCGNEDVSSHYYTRSRRSEFYLSKDGMLDEYFEEAVEDAKKHFDRQSRKGQLDAVKAYRVRLRKDIIYANKELKETLKWRRRLQ